jgi:hypothetical protein
MALAFTFKAAKAETGYSVAKLYELAKEGKIDVRKDCKKSLITAESLRNHIENLPSANLGADSKMRALVRRRWNKRKEVA